MGWVITGIAISVLVGWAFDVPFLKRLRHDWVTMKVMTAVSSLQAGLMVSLLRSRGALANTAAAWLAFLVLATMLMMTCSALWNMNLGFERLFVEESPEAANLSAAPGEPSIATMVGFITAAVGAIFSLHPSGRQIKLLLFGATGAIGLIGILGYVLGTSPYHVPDKSSAMAAHTALVLALLGIEGCRLPPPPSTYDREWK